MISLLVFEAYSNRYDRSLDLNETIYSSLKNSGY